MIKRALVFALALTTASVSPSSEVAAVSLTQGPSGWQRTDSQHFEIHYLPALATELDKVIRSAESAYGLISGRLNFTLATKVPLIMFSPSGAFTLDEADGWSDDDERLMRELVAAGNVPALSRLVGSGQVTNPRLNDALGRVAFDYIESRWGSPSIRRFIDALIVPRVDKTYDFVFDLTPAQFDAEFRQYAERRFRSVVR